jgi:hypothetical protein
VNLQITEAKEFLRAPHPSSCEVVDELVPTLSSIGQSENLSSLHVWTLYEDVRVAGAGRAILADHGRAFEPPAPVQYLPDRYDRCCGLGRRREHARPDAMGLGPWLVEETAEGREGSDIQRSERHDCGQADVPRFLQAAALPHSGVGLLRMGDHTRRQATLLLHPTGRPQVITIAGVQDGWTEPQSGERLRSCSMVITEANKFVSDIHNRMPVILETEHFEQWTNGEANDAAALMKPASEDLLQKWPVSRRVNSSRADDSDATLIEKIDL